jgi:Mn2+/Fe2+ NRAMP family transporter
LFFWQTSEEVEEHGSAKKKIITKHELREMRGDVTLGMFFSNLVTFFIIALTGSLFFGNGVRVETIRDAAEALRPLAGNAAYLLFTLGVLGTGLLAIPVLAGSAAYIFAEVFKTKEGLSQPFRKAIQFYGVIILSVVLGLAMSFVGVNPVTALFYTAVLYGLLSPPLILIIMIIANNKKIMGRFRNKWVSNVLGGLCFLVMAAAALGMMLI